MSSRVYRSPGTPDPDRAPWEKTHPKLRAARRDAEQAGKRPAQAVMDKLNRARGAAGQAPLEPQPPVPPPQDPVSSFWGTPRTDGSLAATPAPDEFLSGEEEFFDPATGWDFQAITSRQIEAVRSQEAPTVAESGEFSVEIEPGEPLPPPVPSPATVDQALQRAQELFGGKRDDEALDLLAAASRAAPEDARLTTWIEFGERRVMRRHCPTGGLDRVPRLAHPLDTLLRVASPEQARLLHSVDGVSNAAALRQQLGLGASTFWALAGRLVERGWMNWLDDA